MNEYDLLIYLSIGIITFIAYVFLFAEKDAQEGVDIGWYGNILVLLACLIAWPLAIFALLHDGKPKAQGF